MRGKALSGNSVTFGDFGVQSMERCWITARQIEAGRKAIANYTKRKGKYWVRIFPDKPITKKPAEVRMGKGKGSVEEYVCVVKPGRIIYEISGIEEQIAVEALRRAAQKLPVKTKILSREALF